MVLRQNSSSMETSSILPTVDFFPSPLPRRTTTTSAQHAVSSAKDTAYASTVGPEVLLYNTGCRSLLQPRSPVLLRAYSRVLDRWSLATLFLLRIPVIKNTSLYLFEPWSTKHDPSIFTWHKKWSPHSAAEVCTAEYRDITDADFTAPLVPMSNSMASLSQKAENHQ
jgi:hypothetical protein